MNGKNTSKIYEPVLVVVVGLLIFFFFTENIWLAKISLIIGLVGLLSKKAAHILATVFYKATSLLGWLNARILLGSIFFLILVPIAFLYRWSKRDFLNLKKTNESMFKDRNHTFKAKDLENTW